ncbi:MAG: hypothetical protein LLG40_06010, partial [Deltaproteobacteria bacterium]|nr:hypothetical protein [Deltaproteobacteria bacterium]
MGLEPTPSGVTDLFFQPTSFSLNLPFFIIIVTYQLFTNDAIYLDLLQNFCKCIAEVGNRVGNLPSGFPLYISGSLFPSS